MKAKIIVSIILIALALTACSPAATPAPAYSGAEKVSETVMVNQEGQTIVQPAMEAPAATEAAAAVAEDTVTFQNPQQPAGRMIIKDAIMDLLVQDSDVAINRITSLSADMGGYVISSRTWVENGFVNAELRMGVPSAKFEETVNYLRKLGSKVLNEQISGQDVSADYADLRSRLANLEATAARVREFLAQAKTVEESLKINAKLSDLEGQIEQVKGQMKYYEGRSAFSTINVTLHPQIPTATPGPTPTPTPGWSPGRTAGNASIRMVSMLQALADLVIWVTFLAGPFALVGFVFWVLYRRARSKRPLPQ